MFFLTIYSPSVTVSMFNLIVSLSKNCYCYLNLMFFVFSLTKKKLRIKRALRFSVFLSFFITKNSFKKHE